MGEIGQVGTRMNPNGIKKGQNGTKWDKRGAKRGKMAQNGVGGDQIGA